MSDSPVHVAPALLQWLRGFAPVALPAGAGQRARMVAGALIGILVTAWASHAFDVPRGLSWIVAPMGASAVLVATSAASLTKARRSMATSLPSMRMIASAPVAEPGALPGQFTTDVYSQ